MTNIDENIKTLFNILEIPEEKAEEALSELGINSLSDEELPTFLEKCGKELIDRRRWNKYFKMLAHMNEHGINF